MDQESALTSKGQTTIPKGIRDRLAMQPGDRMTFTLMPDGTVLMRVKNKSVLGLAGILREKGRKPEPIDQLSRRLSVSTLTYSFAFSLETSNLSSTERAD